ncbi:Carcinine transporter, partial [Armadillidium nasatum]
YIYIYRIMPKSPRWLLSKGRIDECTEILVKIAKINGKEIEREILLKELKSVKSDEVHDFNLQIIIKT